MKDKIEEFKKQTHVNVQAEGDGTHSDCSDLHSDGESAQGHQGQLNVTKDFYKNIKENPFIILPDKKLMKEALKLGMPQFEIFDKQVLVNKEDLNREISANTTRINKGKGNGSIELFWTL